MLSDSPNLAFCNGLRNRTLENATLLRGESPQEWLCHCGDYMIVVRYQDGYLGMGVGETEHETYGDIKVVGIWTPTAESPYKKEISFSEIIDYMNWTIDDGAWFE